MPTHRVQYIADRLQSVLTTRGDQTRCRIAAEMLEHAPTCSTRTCLRRSVAAAYPYAPFLCAPNVYARPDRTRFSFLQSWNCCSTVSTTPNPSGPPSPLPRLLVLIAWRLPESPRLLSPGHAHGFREPPRVLDDLAAVATSDRRRG